MMEEKRYNKNSNLIKFLNEYVEIFQDDVNSMISDMVDFANEYEIENKCRLKEYEIYSVMVHLLDKVKDDIKNEFGIVDTKSVEKEK